MNAPLKTGTEPWTTLFGGNDPAARVIEMRLIRKRGEPLLLLPGDSSAAAKTLALYPAQTFPARVARSGLRMALKAGLSSGTERISLPISGKNSFVQFLAASADEKAVEIPAFGVLAGNARSPGQRFIFLVFDSSGLPKAAIKVGVCERAKELITRERNFLAATPRALGIPRLRGTFTSPDAQAFAMDFIDGRSPSQKDVDNVSNILSEWIDPARSIPISELWVWRELERACGEKPLMTRLREALKTRAVKASIFHGDFAPWNIKVSAEGKWNVLDWERGDAAGPPAWDWFHFAIQPPMLARKCSIPELVEISESLLGSAAFRRYSERANLVGCERNWLLAYLLYQREVIKPSEGLQQTSALVETLTSKWLVI